MIPSTREFKPVQARPIGPDAMRRWDQKRKNETIGRRYGQHFGIEAGEDGRSAQVGINPKVLWNEA